MKTKNSKRILSVKILSMTDDSPDTSYLGEYSDHRTSEFSIDRAHAEDCASIKPDSHAIVEKLERVISYLDGIRTSSEVANDPDNTEWESLDEAIDILIGLQDDVIECDCSQNGYFDPRGYHVSGHEFRYFNGPVENYEGETPEDIRKYVRQDFERMESYNAGDWSYIGIRAEAEVCIERDIESNIHREINSLGPIQRITSGGLWGIESDSDREHLAGIGNEELDELKTQLKALGFSSRAISQAFKSVKEVCQ